jgi:hypothetical protein
MGETDLPVPAQLETQLAKCKTVRKADVYYKSREKSSAVRHHFPDICLFCLFVVAVVHRNHVRYI